MTREEAESVLEAGKHVYHSVWCFSANYMSCGEGCCDDTLEGVENALDTIERMCGGKWEDVHEAGF